MSSAPQFTFKCATCDELHVGMPTFGASAPLSFYEIAKDERETRCKLDSDACVIDNEFFFVRGCLDIHVHGQAESFSWGAWVSLSKANFETWVQYREVPKRSHIGPFFGWLNAWIKPYPDTVNLKTMLHLRDDGIRPYIELEPTDHPLAIEQRDGISVARVGEIYSLMMK